MAENGEVIIHPYGRICLSSPYDLQRIAAAQATLQPPDHEENGDRVLISVATGVAIGKAGVWVIGTIAGGLIGDSAVKAVSNIIGLQDMEEKAVELSKIELMHVCLWMQANANPVDKVSMTCHH